MDGSKNTQLAADLRKSSHENFMVKHRRNWPSSGHIHTRLDIASPERHGTKSAPKSPEDFLNQMLQRRFIHKPRPAST
jgi:hypothetical protein